MAIKQQTIVLTVTFEEEITHENSVLKVISDVLLNDASVIEFEHSIEKEETLSYNMFIDDDLYD